METRREFVKKAMLLAAGVGITPAIEKALAIDPAPGSTWKDAEHVVILMQENRSFDHVYGSLRGVRGFSDPRAVTLPNGHPVWLQTNASGETYAPFRLDIQGTNATWMGSLPHSWVDQVDARNQGKHDGWLDAKRSGNQEFSRLPLTLGYYTRADLAFYYALADAFTICDQNFCSSLTGTTPNRLYLWTGTIREQPTLASKACVRNEDVDYDREVRWATFPERLEAAGISWRVYQNELSLPSGLSGEADAWLSNFTDNPLEWFTQYHVRYNAFRRHQVAREHALAEQLRALEAQPPPRSGAAERQLELLRQEVGQLRRDRATWNEAAFAKLPAREQNLHRKAFTTNEADPAYRELIAVRYQDQGVDREMAVPKGDVLHQFRQDVRNGQLPTVSWLVAPERFSDHPGSPWYGAWYVSETLDILTQNPEVWKKTIFILCYDENDGYFDHIPPFVPPPPGSNEAGKVSGGIDVAAEYVGAAQEEEFSKRNRGPAGRTGPIGLGFRVPLVIASPWSRGGYVCSQVFDHTSILQFLERFLTHKTGEPIREPNITAWRRAVCGDLTSTFRPYPGSAIGSPEKVDRDTFFAGIHQAQFRKTPTCPPPLSALQIDQAKEAPARCSFLPRQEAGGRLSCALPYGLAVEGWLSADRQHFELHFSALREVCGQQGAGSPFRVCSPAKYRVDSPASGWEAGRVWDYALAAGTDLRDSWPLANFEESTCHLRVYGPNGFFREFRNPKESPALRCSVFPTPLNPGQPAVLTVELSNHEAGRTLTVVLEQTAYDRVRREVTLSPAGTSGATAKVEFNVEASYGWYELRLMVAGHAGFEQRYAGRIETGKDSRSDPLLG